MLWNAVQMAAIADSDHVVSPFEGLLGNKESKSNSSALSSSSCVAEDDSKSNFTARTSSSCLAAVFVMALIACNLSSTVVASELLQQDSVTKVAPLFMIYFNVSWDLLCFVALYFTRRYCDAEGVGAPSQHSHMHVARSAAALCFVYQVGNWLYFVGLENISVTVSMIMYQSSSAWVLLLSVMLLPGETFDWRRAGAVLVSLLGVALVALDNWDNKKSSWTSTGAMLISGILWALYEVLLKKWLPDANSADSLFFVGCRGATNLLFCWPFLVGASAAGYDVWPVPGQRYGWGGLIIMALISVCLTLLITLGIAWTSPIFVRLGSMLTVPASTLFVDVAWHHLSPGWPRYAGSAYVMLGFVLTGVPGSRSATSQTDYSHDNGLAAKLRDVGLCTTIVLGAFLIVIRAMSGD